jgi:hypothetical protein
LKFFNSSMDCYDDSKRKTKTKIFMNGSQESLDKFQIVIHCSVLIKISKFLILEFEALVVYPY